MTQRSKVSVAIATYNGEKYIGEQFLSLINQTRKPDEIIVVDDNSTDDTVNILKTYIEKYKLNCKIYNNVENVGHQKSFDKAIQLCTGDIIFLCDQDDVWYTNKIEYIENIFNKKPEINVVINDLDICDQRLEKLGYSVIEQTINSGTFGKDGKSFIIGCGTAFRSSLRILINPIPDIPYGHDKWIHEIGNFLASRKVIEHKLQLYRRHGNNSSSWAFDLKRKANWSDMTNPSKNSDLRLSYLNQLEIVAAIYRRVLVLSTDEFENLNIKHAKSIISSRIEIAMRSITSRIELLASNTLNMKLKSLKMFMFGEYNYFLGFRSFLKDFILRKPI
jgi:glycosyltransferase involved in cell wall biosynthesis